MPCIALSCDPSPLLTIAMLCRFIAAFVTDVMFGAVVFERLGLTPEESRTDPFAVADAAYYIACDANIVAENTKIATQYAAKAAAKPTNKK